MFSRIQTSPLANLSVKDSGHSHHGCLKRLRKRLLGDRVCTWPDTTTPLILHTRVCVYACICCCHLVAKLCPTLCDPMDCSPPGSSVHEILQARMLERVASSCSNVCVCVCVCACMGMCVCVHIPFFLSLPPTSPHPTPLGHHRALS